MAAKYATHVSTKVTPQSEPIPGSKQVKNSAGGYVFEIDKWARLRRFLILGNEGGTYYASEKKLTVENAKCIGECLAEDGTRTVREIVEISNSGRAPKNDPAIFALGLIIGNPLRGQLDGLEEAVIKVCRTGTHIMQLVETINQVGGWGRSVKRCVAGWYLEQKPADLAYQIVKYQNRNGWCHRDILRLCHAKATDERRNFILKYAVGKADEMLPPAGAGLDPFSDFAAIHAANEAKRCSERDLIPLIRHFRLPRECVPTKHLNSPAVWEALLHVGMPITALVRNLGKTTAIELLKPLGESTKYVCDRLTDEEGLKKGRVHPLSILIALKTYQQGHGDKGKLHWTPVPQICDALNDAFYKAFQTIEPTGKRWLFGLDVSGSMASGNIAGCPLTPREGAAALAMVGLRTEQQCYVHGFQGGAGRWRGYGLETIDDPLVGFIELGLTKNMSLPEVIQRTSNLPFGGTDCAIPILYALKKQIPVDVFVTATDNETYAGNIHPTQALKQYRKEMGINAKAIVVGMTAVGWSVADPLDPLQLDVAGMDAAAPAIMADFARGGENGAW